MKINNFSQIFKECVLKEALGENLQRFAQKYQIPTETNKRYQKNNVIKKPLGWLFSHDPNIENLEIEVKTAKDVDTLLQDRSIIILGISAEMPDTGMIPVGWTYRDFQYGGFRTTYIKSVDSDLNNVQIINDIFSEMIGIPMVKQDRWSSKEIRKSPTLKQLVALAKKAKVPLSFEYVKSEQDELRTIKGAREKIQFELKNLNDPDFLRKGLQSRLEKFKLTKMDSVEDFEKVEQLISQKGVIDKIKIDGFGYKLKDYDFRRRLEPSSGNLMSGEIGYLEYQLVGAIDGKAVQTKDKLIELQQMIEDATDSDERKFIKDKFNKILSQIPYEFKVDLVLEGSQIKALPTKRQSSFWASDEIRFKLGLKNFSEL